MSVYLLHCVEGFKPQLKTLSKERQQPRHSGSHLYLVPDILTDALFVIDRKVDALIKLHEGAPCRTDHFDIYKIALDLNEREPEGNLMRVKSLGDRVLFLGRNSPMIWPVNSPVSKEITYIMHTTLIDVIVLVDVEVMIRVFST